jgi:signal transduction histidine kinase
MQKILREAERCTDLINQLLWLARADAGTSRIELVSTDLTALVKNVVNEIQILASSKGLLVLTRLPEVAVPAEVDEPSFRRMLLILLDNGIKYTPEGGKLTILLTQNAGQISVAISDTGAGISADQLPFLFDRFWRADKVRSRDAGGTGLGLAIAREIAQSHGAELLVESSLGQGSTFTVRLRRSLTARPSQLEVSGYRSS